MQEHIDAHLEKAREEPENAAVRGRLGLALASNGLWMAARDTFAAAAWLDPDDELSHYYHGVAFQEVGDHESALEVLEQVTRQFPEFAPAQHRYGEIALDHGLLDEAERAFDQAVTRAGRLPHGYLGLATVHLRRGSFDGARRLAEQAIYLASGDPRPHYLLGMALRGLEKRDEARTHLKAGVSQTMSYMPDDWTALLRDHDKSSAGQITLARTLMDGGKHDAARQILETALQYYPESFDVLHSLGSAILKLGNPRQALELFKKAERVDPVRVDAHLSLGETYEVLGDKKEAVWHARRAKDLDPTDPRIDKLLRRLRGGEAR